MSDFSQIDYINSIGLFEKEEKEGRRYKMGDLRTSLILRENNINFGEVKRIASALPDPRLVIIGEGNQSGFYIYSHALKKCFISKFTEHKVLIGKA